MRPSAPVKTLTLKLPDSLAAEIAAEAGARRISKSEVVRERLTRKTGALNKTRAGSLWSQMADLVIQSDSLPADLSSNKVHLRGYGKIRPHR